VLSYYPDFIFEREESDVIVEVKADNQIEDAVVQAKKEYAHANGISQWDGISTYEILGCGQATLSDAAVKAGSVSV